MINSKTFSGEADLAIQANVYGRVLGLDISLAGRIYIRNMTLETAHALADWIIANVPKPEPIPLPTKFAAVVKSDGRRFVRTDHTMYPWTNVAGTYSDQKIRNMGFEVVFEGVDK